jgi:hypothetical protein
MNQCPKCGQYCSTISHCPKCNTNICDRCGIEHRDKIYCRDHPPKAWLQETIDRDVRLSAAALVESIERCKTLNWNHEELDEALRHTKSFLQKLLAQGQK